MLGRHWNIIFKILTAGTFESYLETTALLSRDQFGEMVWNEPGLEKPTQFLQQDRYDLRIPVLARHTINKLRVVFETIRLLSKERVKGSPVPADTEE